jgi:activator of HSP90 ATPase
MVLHNPNNWHWVNKDTSAWAKQWFEDNLTKLEAADGDVTAKITRVVSMDGDVDVSQRKGKIITIYDVKLTLEYSGTLHRSNIVVNVPPLLDCFLLRGVHVV